MCDPQEQRIWFSATAYTESFETLSSKYRRRQRLRKWEEQLRATQYLYRLHDIVNVKVQWVDVLKVYYVQSIPSTMGLRRWIAIPLDWIAQCTRTSDHDGKLHDRLFRQCKWIRPQIALLNLDRRTHHQRSMLSWAIAYAIYQQEIDEVW